MGLEFQDGQSVATQRHRRHRWGFFLHVESYAWHCANHLEFAKSLAARGRPTGRVEHSPPLGFAPRFPTLWRWVVNICPEHKLDQARRVRFIPLDRKGNPLPKREQARIERKQARGGSAKS